MDLEHQTNLKIHPFAAMDATFKYYLKVQPNDVLDLIEPLIEEVKAVDGTFISLWHNESLSENHLWKGYREVYDQVIQLATGN